MIIPRASDRFIPQKRKYVAAPFHMFLLAGTFSQKKEV